MKSKALIVMISEIIKHLFNSNFTVNSNINITDIYQAIFCLES